MPNATETKLRSYFYGRLLVLANSTRLRAIRHSGLDLIAANTFTSGHHQVLGLSIDGPASVIARRNADRTTFDRRLRSDHGAATISVFVAARRLTTVTADAAVTVMHTLAGTRLTFITHHLHGASLTATFRG